MKEESARKTERERPPQAQIRRKGGRCYEPTASRAGVHAFSNPPAVEAFFLFIAGFIFVKNNTDKDDLLYHSRHLGLEFKSFPL